MSNTFIAPFQPHPGPVKHFTHTYTPSPLPSNPPTHWIKPQVHILYWRTTSLLLQSPFSLPLHQNHQPISSFLCVVFYNTKWLLFSHDFKLGVVFCNNFECSTEPGLLKVELVLFSLFFISRSGLLMRCNFFIHSKKLQHT